MPLIRDRIAPVAGAYYSPEEASLITGRTVATLAVWRSNGNQPGLRFTVTGAGKHKRVRYKGADLIAFLEGKCNVEPKKKVRK